MNRRDTGFTFSEVLIATAVSAIIMASLISGAIALQYSFKANAEYAGQESDRTRLADYVARDLRRALSVSLGTDAQGESVLTLTMPDYYRSADPASGDYKIAREPAIAGSSVGWGNPAAPTSIEYRRQGANIYRVEDGVGRVVVENVRNFMITLQDSGSFVKATLWFTPTTSTSRTFTMQPRVPVTATARIRNIRSDR